MVRFLSVNERNYGGEVSFVTKCGHGVFYMVNHDQGTTAMMLGVFFSYSMIQSDSGLILSVPRLCLRSIDGSVHVKGHPQISSFL